MGKKIHRDNSGSNKMTPEEAVGVLEDLCQIYKPPFSLIGNELPGYSFFDNHWPHEIATNDDPPIKLDRKSEVFSIDGLLGLYDPKKQEIIVFNKGIRKVCKILGTSEKSLIYVVRLHEWAHAYFHISSIQEQRLQLSKDETLWPHFLKYSTKLFKNVETGLHESLAQLLTYYSLQWLFGEATSERAKMVIGKIIEAFDLLSSHQPPEYHIYDLMTAPKQRVITSIGLIRKGSLLGKVELWRTIIKW